MLDSNATEVHTDDDCSMGGGSTGLVLGPGEFFGQLSVLQASGNVTESVARNDVMMIVPLVSRPPRGSEDDGEVDPYALLESLATLRKFEQDVEAAERLLVADWGAAHVYDLLRGGRGDGEIAPRWRENGLTAEDALEHVLHWDWSRHSDAYNAHVLAAMHSILMDDPLHFVAPEHGYRANPTFNIASTRAVRTYDRVLQWCDTADGEKQRPEIEGFIERAIAARAEVVRTSELAPSSSTGCTPQSGSIKWTESDAEILRFIVDGGSRLRLIQPSPYVATTAKIIRRVVDAAPAHLGLREKVATLVSLANADVALLFLSAIGAAAPWENWLDRPAQGPPPSNMSSPPPSGSDAARKLEADSARRDFGSMPVYTIDAADAHELDDGLSFERVSDDVAWVHVHVADPTHVVAYGDAASTHASKLLTSVYLPEGSRPMLPERLVRDERLSLGAPHATGADEGGAQRALTLSAKINVQDGTLLESTVSLSFIRNVQRLTYDRVNRDALLSARPSETQRELVLKSGIVTLDERSRGGDRKGEELGERAVTDLQALDRLARALMRQRVEHNALFWSFPSLEAFVQPSLTRTDMRKALQSSLVFPSSPTVTLSLPALDHGEGTTASKRAEQLVSELMVLANRVAARHCVEQGVAVPFRQQPPPRADGDALESLMASRASDTGEIPWREVMACGASVQFEPGTDSLDPGAHWPLGIDDGFGYVRTTSPLRRYLDMVVHWQLKSTLLPSQRSIARDDVRTIIRSSEGPLRAAQRASVRSNTVWACYVLRRMRETQPHHAFWASLTGITQQVAQHSAFTGEGSQRVLVPQLGMLARVELNERQDEIPPGEEVKLKVIGVDVGPQAQLLARRVY